MNSGQEVSEFTETMKGKVVNVLLLVLALVQCGTSHPVPGERSPQDILIKRIYLK